MDNFDTKTKLLKAALDLFSELGYNGASVRAISKKADANIAAVGYYFGGKKGLYEAVAMHIVKELNSSVENIVKEINKQYHNSNIDVMRNLLMRLLLGIATEANNADVSKFAIIIQRAQNNSTVLFDIIFKHFTSIMFDSISKCLRVIMPQRSEIYYTLLSQSLMSQATVFFINKANLLGRLKSKAVSDEHIKVHARILEAQIDAF